jgi:hypothetical protein
MNCDEAIELLTDSLAAPLPGPTAAALAAHLAACEGCRAEAAETRRIWEELERLPEESPGEEMRQRFVAGLEPYLDAARRRSRFGSGGEPGRAFERWGSGLESWLDRWLPRRPLAQAGLAAATLAAGVLIGSGALSQGFGLLRGTRGATAANRAGEGRPSEIGELRQEVRSLSQLVTLSLLKQDSASERLRGVSFGRHAEMADLADLAEIGEPGDDRVLQALLDTLSHDPDVNVRLAAVDALAPALGRPPVRDRMLTEVVTQRSPMVQIALIDLLMGRDRAGSQRRLQELAASPSLDETVRGYLRSRLRQVS